MAKTNRPAILGLVEKAWGSVGQEAGTEETLSSEAHPDTQISRSGGGSGKAPGYGGRKGQRKAPVKPPRRP